MAAASSAPPRRSSAAPDAGAGLHRSTSSSYNVGSAPHYTSTRRHSLYGTEDRIIIDPGSKVWKVGFSGEGKPRQVYNVARPSEEPTLWNWNMSKTTEDQEESERILAARMQQSLRAVFFDILMTDPKSRKVIIVEHPLLPIGVKDLMARILFDNLNVPSLSFASSHMLALLAAGRTTALVVDCGHLETTALPISSSRPMFPLLRTTPLAGARFTEYLRELILAFGIYHPPLPSLTGFANAASQLTRVPAELLTDTIVEDIKTNYCFVASASDPPLFTNNLGSHAFGPVDTTPVSDDHMSIDIEPSPSHGPTLSVDIPTGRRSGIQSGQQSGTHTPHTPSRSPAPQPAPFEALAAHYERQSTTTELLYRVTAPNSAATGRGIIRIPGWVRERVAECLFETGDVDQCSVAEVVLQTVLKVPMDLRRRMISNILVIGGTAMLPGFIPRLQDELVRILDTQVPPSPTKTRRSYGPYEPLRALSAHVAVLNNPSPPPSTSISSQSSGKAPAFAPICLAWVGGSLAGALKIGGEEILHERWDEANAEDPDASFRETFVREPPPILPDWTRMPMSVGAPHAGIHPPQQFGFSSTAEASIA